jgi:hypothetical protein
MTPLFQITPDLTLRMVTEKDEPLLRQWIEADPDHKETSSVEFFSTQSPIEECYVLEDQAGPLFFLKTTRAIRLDIQFGPPIMRERMRKGLQQGFPWLETMLGMRNFGEVMFATQNPELARSMEKRLGFRRSTEELVRPLNRRA